MKKSLQNKVAVVSGASSGIGLAIAEMLTARGAKVVNVSDRPAETQFDAAYICDISDDTALQSTIQAIAECYGKVDFLFCNAGFGIGGGVESAEIGAIDKLFNVNLIAHVKAVHMFLPHMQNGGKIFFTGSLASVIPLPYQACYSASKAAIENFSRALNTELLSRKICVCTIMPGDTKTGFTDARVKFTDGSSAQSRSIKKMEHAERHGKGPETVAKTVSKLVDKKCLPLRVAVGFGNKALCFLVKILPARWVNFLVRKIYI